MQLPDATFFQTRIMNIGTALFFCEDKYMLPHSAYMVTALKADEENCIWFLISGSWNKSVCYDLTCAASLEFYRKGYPMSLSIDGHASLVNDRTMIQGFMQDLLGKSVQVKEEDISGVLLVKVKISNATYKELDGKKSHNSFQHLFAGFKSWRLTNQTQLQPSI